MRPGERIQLEIEIDGSSFRVTDRQQGHVVIHVSTCSALPLHLFTQIRQVINELVSDYLTRRMDPEGK